VKGKKTFRAVDIILLSMVFLPILAGIALKVLYVPAPEGIDVTGAFIFFTAELGFASIPITEAQVNSWLVIISVFFLCLYLTHGIRAGVSTRRQLAAEWAVEKCEGLISENMGEHFSGFAPFIAAVMVLSALSSLMSLFGLFPPTSDLNVAAGWAILVFILITYYKMKCGPVNYLKSFAQPVPFLTPLNVISEVATPVSMAFRHFGNILSGTVVSALVAAGLQGLSHALLGWLPGKLGEIPFLQIGLPAVLSVYFDLFSSVLQAFIFAMLTMLYVAGAFDYETYSKRKEKKSNKSVTYGG